MKNKAFDARSHAFLDSDSILVDANIWLYLLGPASVSPRWTAVYSGVFKRIDSAGSDLFLDTLILSEFINRFARIEMQRIQPGQSNFKAFRDSNDFQAVAQSIESQVNVMLSLCRPIDHPFSEWNLSDLLKDFSTGTVDWNDQLIVENCRKHSLALLTNDGDFTHGGISVFTANTKLLAACP